MIRPFKKNVAEWPIARVGPLLEAPAAPGRTVDDALIRWFKNIIVQKS